MTKAKKTIFSGEMQLATK